MDTPLIESAFHDWWLDSYNRPPNPQAVMTHVAFARHMLEMAKVCTQLTEQQQALLKQYHQANGALDAADLASEEAANTYSAAIDACHYAGFDPLRYPSNITKQENLDG
jgi:hypothetical protein